MSALVAGVATVVWTTATTASSPTKWSARSPRRTSCGRCSRSSLATPAAPPHRRKAREHALERFSVARYCARLRAFLQQTRHARPYLALADRVSEGLVELGSGPLDGLAGRLVREIAWFGSPVGRSA